MKDACWLLLAPGYERRAALLALTEVAEALGREQGLTSVHLLFCAEDKVFSLPSTGPVLGPLPDVDPSNDGLDTDGDGLTNRYEYYADTDPFDPATNGIPDGADDPDSDGLVNLEEQDILTHPRDVDTDDDGITDALFTFTSPITGSYFWCPPMNKGKISW